jgi:transcriptional regulator with XRE-family HTH domain
MLLNYKSQAPLNHARLVYLYTSKMSIGARIRKLREENELSGEKFGELCGVTKGMVSQWESDIVTPPTDRLIEIKKHLDFSYDWLISGHISDYSNKIRPPIKALLEIAQQLPDTEVAELAHQGNVFAKLITQKSEGTNGKQ